MSILKTTTVNAIHSNTINIDSFDSYCSNMDIEISDFNM